MKAFQATASGHGAKTASTPRAAALAFFEAFPKARKCDVREGETDGASFTIRLSLVATGKYQRWNDVTRRTTHELPDA